MVALRPDGVGRRAGQAGVGFDGFVKDLDAPPFLVDCRDAAVVEQEVARRQIEDTDASVFVRKDLLRPSTGKGTPLM